LVVVIAVFVIMLVYPPFHVVTDKGVEDNMGYGLIFDPPKRGYIGATVNVLMLLIQWLGVLIAGGLAFFLNKSLSQETQGSSFDFRNESTPPPQPHVTSGNESIANSYSQKKQDPIGGMGGWLLLLVIQMMIIGPFLGTGQIYGDFKEAEHQYPALTMLDEWRSYKQATWCLFLGFAALSIYGGWGLARGNKWIVVKRAKIILWVIGPAALVVRELLPIISFGKANAEITQFAGAFIASFIVSAIWTAYLSKSKRVRNTYSNRDE
jgi:hypothetical protein